MQKHKSITTIKIQTAALETMINCSLLPRLVKIKLLFLYEVELEEQAECVDLGLVWKEDLRCSEDLTLDLL